MCSCVLRTRPGAPVSACCTRPLGACGHWLQVYTRTAYPHMWILLLDHIEQHAGRMNAGSLQALLPLLEEVRRVHVCMRACHAMRIAEAGLAACCMPAALAVLLLLHCSTARCGMLTERPLPLPCPLAIPCRTLLLTACGVRYRWRWRSPTRWQLQEQGARLKGKPLKCDACTASRVVEVVVLHVQRRIRIGDLAAAVYSTASCLGKRKGMYTEHRPAMIA